MPSWASASKVGVRTSRVGDGRFQPTFANPTCRTHSVKQCVRACACARAQRGARTSSARHMTMCGLARCAGCPAQKRSTTASLHSRSCQAETNFFSLHVNISAIRNTCVAHLPVRSHAEDAVPDIRSARAPTEWLELRRITAPLRAERRQLQQQQQQQHQGA